MDHQVTVRQCGQPLKAHWEISQVHPNEENVQYIFTICDPDLTPALISQIKVNHKLMDMNQPTNQHWGPESITFCRKGVGRALQKMYNLIYLNYSNSEYYCKFEMF